MNDEELKELKKLWKTESKMPTVDIDGLKKLSDDGYRKLRRKARIDSWVQGLTAVACLIPVFFYPRLIFAAFLALILGVWYIRELRGLYKGWRFNIASVSVRESTKARLEYLKRFFWRTRVAVYIFAPLTLTATFFGLGYFENPGVTPDRWIIWLAKNILITEVLTVIFCEIYFAFLYKPALKELREISRQLDSTEA